MDSTPATPRYLATFDFSLALNPEPTCFIFPDSSAVRIDWTGMLLSTSGAGAFTGLFGLWQVEQMVVKIAAPLRFWASIWPAKPTRKTAAEIGSRMPVFIES